MKKNEESVNGLLPTALTLLIYSAAGVIVALIVSLLFSVLVLTELLPQDFTPIASSVSVFIASLTVSVLSCKKLGKPILTALVQALLILLLLFIVGALLYGRLIPTSLPLGIIASSFLGALLGAVLSATGKKKKKAKRK